MTRPPPGLQTPSAIEVMHVVGTYSATSAAAIRAVMPMRALLSDHVVTLIIRGSCLLLPPSPLRVQDVEVSRQ